MFIQMFFLKFIALLKGEGSTSKVTFTLYLKLKKIRTNETIREKVQNYENICKNTFVYAQKPVKTDDFSEVDEKEVKEHVEKKKQYKGKLQKKINI